LVGEPADSQQDVGLATRKGEKVEINVLSGSSALSPGLPTGNVEEVGRLLSPLSRDEVGTIRCIGLNYRQHAAEVKMAIPTEPTVFLKPALALADPYPAPTIVPKFAVKDNCSDYESELTIVIGKDCKNVTEAEAPKYVLGYTAANDVSSRKSQLSQSQWCFSKGFDGACPIGPTIVSKELMEDVSKARIRGLWNGKVVQDCGLDDLVFNIPQLVSFLSQGTTLPAGTIIITGTPAGVGLGKQQFVQDGDEIAVEIKPHIGTLITQYVLEK